MIVLWHGQAPDYLSELCTPVAQVVQLLRHITPVAQHSSVDVTSYTIVAGRLAGVVVPGLWQRDARRSTWQPARQTTVCDERRCTTCLLCAEVRAHHPATP